MNLLARTLTLSLLAALATAFSAAAADDLDPETRAALEAARKASEKAGVKTPDLKKLMEEADEADAAEKKPVAKGKPGAVKAAPLKPAAAKPATEKPEPLKALPDWVTPLPGFQLAPGGKRWTEDEVEKGEISGTVPGAPREVAEGWAKAAKEHFRGVTTNDVTVNGALTMTVFATYLKEELLEHKVELEIKPGKGGKTSAVKLTYSIGGEP